jgi:hypothetical protein
MGSLVINNNHFLERARTIRNELSNKTDIYVLSEYPYTLKKQMLIKKIRQEAKHFVNDNEIKTAVLGK